jgi:hypothetical protein
MLKYNTPCISRTSRKLQRRGWKKRVKSITGLSQNKCIHSNTWQPCVLTFTHRLSSVDDLVSPFQGPSISSLVREVEGLPLLGSSWRSLLPSSSVKTTQIHRYDLRLLHHRKFAKFHQVSVGTSPSFTKNLIFTCWSVTAVENTSHPLSSCSWIVSDLICWSRSSARNK